MFLSTNLKSNYIIYLFKKQKNKQGLIYFVDV